MERLMLPAVLLGVALMVLAIAGVFFIAEGHIPIVNRLIFVAFITSFLGYFTLYKRNK